MSKSTQEKLEEIKEPNYHKNISNWDLLMGKSVAPIDRLKIISEDDFEELIEEWIHGYLKKKYKKIEKVIRLAGAGDKGRDIVAYEKYSKDGKEIWDNYQCKHYNAPLSPSKMWIELGKVCYYTYIEDYSIPQNYYFVAPLGVGSTFSDLLSKPENLKQGLIENWNNKCLKQITNREIELKGDFKLYVENFDFSIFHSLDPGELIEQYQQTIYFPFRFGGGLTKNLERIKKPADIKETEQLYVKKLYKAYSNYKKVEINNLLQLKNNQRLFSHFQRQRTYFYQAESLRVFERDSFPNGLNSFEKLKEEIYHGVIDTVYGEHENGYERVIATTEKASTLETSVGNLLINFVDVKDKMGICHHLANDYGSEDKEEILWVIDNEE